MLHDIVLSAEIKVAVVDVPFKSIQCYYATCRPIYGLKHVHVCLSVFPSFEPCAQYGLSIEYT